MKTPFSSFSNNHNTQYIFNEIPSSDGAETASSAPIENKKDDAKKVIVSIVDLGEDGKEITRKIKDDIIEGSDLGETTANEAMAIVNNTEENTRIDNAVEWNGFSTVKLGDVERAILELQDDSIISDLGRELSNRDKVGIKNYVDEKEGISYTKSSGEKVTLPLHEVIKKSFGRLNVYITTHNVGQSLFGKACLRKGLNEVDVQNLWELIHTGKAHEDIESRANLLQDIYKKLNLTRGLVEGKTDKFFGSGTLRDTESLTIFIESILSNEILWSNFHDTLYPTSNGSPQRFRRALNNIKEKGAYDPENDPLKIFDNTIVATGGGGRKQYTIGFLATIPDDVLDRATNHNVDIKNTILANRTYREDVVRRWEEFQVQNPQYFQDEMLAKK